MRGWFPQVARRWEWKVKNRMECNQNIDKTTLICPNGEIAGSGFKSERTIVKWSEIPATVIRQKENGTVGRTRPLLYGRSTQSIFFIVIELVALCFTNKTPYEQKRGWVHKENCVWHRKRHGKREMKIGREIEERQREKRKKGRERALDRGLQSWIPTSQRTDDKRLARIKQEKVSDVPEKTMGFFTPQSLSTVSRNPNSDYFICCIVCRQIIEWNFSSIIYCVR